MFIKINVKTGAKKEIFKKLAEDRFEISIREKAEKGLANKRVIEMVRERLIQYNVKEVRLVSGHQSPHKIISVSFKDK